MVARRKCFPIQNFANSYLNGLKPKSWPHTVQVSEGGAFLWHIVFQNQYGKPKFR